MNNVLGYNYETVKDSIGRVQSAYNELIAALKDGTQSKFIGAMAQVWACNDAISFFNDTFKPSAENLINAETNSVNAVFQSIADSMNYAARVWAEQTQSEHTNVSFSVTPVTLDVSGVQENINGIRGIDKDSAEAAKNSLQEISSAASDALAKAEAAVVGCGFLGGEQENNLIATMKVINSNITNGYNNFVTETESAIQQTVTTYEDTAGRIATAFSSHYV